MKRKNAPKPKENAGYAARTSQSVTDNTGTKTRSQSPLKQRPTTSKGANSGDVRSKLNKAKKRSQTTALQEMKTLQKTTALLIPKAPFVRLVKTLVQERAGQQFRLTETAVEALRESAESFLVSMFEDSYLMSLHAKRVTLMPRDINLLLHIRRDPYTER